MNIQNDVRKTILNSQNTFKNNIQKNFKPDPNTLDLSKGKRQEPKSIKEDGLEKSITDFAKESTTEQLQDFIKKGSDNEELLKAASDELLDRATDLLIKGEGDRGGKVIGHTKSGKAIYEKHKAEHPHYSDFTANEHKEASKIHKEHMEKVPKNTTDTSRLVHFTESQKHDFLANQKSSNKQIHHDHTFTKNSGKWDLEGKSGQHDEIKHGTKVGVMSSGKGGKIARTGCIVKQGDTEHHVLMNDTNTVEKHHKNDLYNNE